MATGLPGPCGAYAHQLRVASRSKLSVVEVSYGMGWSSIVFYCILFCMYGVYCIRASTCVSIRFRPVILLVDLLKGPIEPN